MKPADLHPAIREALAVHEAFRRLDFMPDEIYMRPAPTKLFITVRRADKEFNVLVGEHDVPRADLITMWAVAAKWWNNTTEANRREIYETSAIRKGAVGLLVALQDNGFVLGRTDA